MLNMADFMLNLFYEEKKKDLENKRTKTIPHNLIG